MKIDIVAVKDVFTPNKTGLKKESHQSFSQKESSSKDFDSIFKKENAKFYDDYDEELFR